MIRKCLHILQRHSHWGGAVRSSDETAVMAVERRGSVRYVPALCTTAIVGGCI
jgi:hypothetical protein